MALEQDAGDLGLGAQRDVGALQGRAQEGVGAGGPQALVRIDLIDADALWRWTVEIIRMGKAKGLSRLDELVAQGMGAAGDVGDMDRTARAVIGAGPVIMVFGLAKEGQHLVPAPAGIAHSLPLIEIVRLAPDIDHGIDRAGPANDLAPRPIANPSTQIRLSLSIIHPVDRPVEEGAAIADGQLDPDRPVRTPRLQHQHRRLTVRRQTIGHHAARRACTDDHIIKTVHHKTGCWVISRCSMVPV